MPRPPATASMARELCQELGLVGAPIAVPVAVTTTTMVAAESACTSTLTVLVIHHTFAFA